MGLEKRAPTTKRENDRIKTREEQSLLRAHKRREHSNSETLNWILGAILDISLCIGRLTLGCLVICLKLISHLNVIALDA